MFTDGILFLVVLALLAERFLAGERWEAERARLINTIIARTPGEVKMLNEPPRPRLVPEPTVLEGFEGQAGLD